MAQYLAISSANSGWLFPAMTINSPTLLRSILSIICLQEGTKERINNSFSNHGEHLEEIKGYSSVAFLEKNYVRAKSCKVDSCWMEMKI